MITIYGRRNSSNVQLVMWAIHELGLEHQRLDNGHGYRSATSEEFLQKNPAGKIPVLEDGEVQMFESAAILRYLAAKYGDDDFWPEDPEKRATVDTWAEWGKNTFAEAVLEIFVYDVRLEPQTRDPGILAAAVDKVVPLARILDSRLASREWLGADKFSNADIACGHILHRYFTLDWQRPTLAALDDYYHRLQKRAAYRDHAMVSYEALRGSY